jgi:hypothetical protein
MQLMHKSYLSALDPDSGRLMSDPAPISEPVAGRELVRSPDFSRDGKYLAYYVAPAPKQSPKGPQYGPGSIVIRTLETGEEREVTLSPRLSYTGAHGHLSWAPDGRSIFICGRAETGRHGIYRADIETGNLTPVVLEGPEQAKDDWQLHLNFDLKEGEVVLWGEPSANGKTLFFPRYYFDPEAWGMERISQCRIVARNIETDEERQVYRTAVGGLFFGVSPDGKRLFVASEKSLKIFPIAGGEPRELLESEGEFHENVPSTITWTADGRHLLFVSCSQGKATLWQISAQGGEAESLGEVSATLGWKVSSLRMHPDGRQIAFARHWWQRQARIRMLQIVVSDGLAKEMCATHLRTIGEAIDRYKNDRGDVPDVFADLYPDYLQDRNLLLCPADQSGGKTVEDAKDPQMRCSYRYMFGPATQGVSGLTVALPADFPARDGMTFKDARKLQLEYFGTVTPILECRHHSPWMFLDYSGDICEAEDYWETSPRAGAELLNHLEVTMKTKPDTWAQRYDAQRFVCLLRYAEGDEAALAKLLKNHLQDHPEDEAAREFLVQLPRLSIIEDDAEEYGDGGVSLGSYDLELIHDNKRGDQVIALHFQDLPVPQGSQIKRAYVQFTAYPEEEPGSEETDLLLHAELVADAKPLATVKHNISSRRKTAASVGWSPEPWTAGGERSEKQRTPDLSPLIQEVVDQPDWKKGNALVLIISGSGRRNAQSCNGGWSGAPMLYVEH